MLSAQEEHESKIDHTNAIYPDCVERKASKVQWISIRHILSCFYDINCKQPDRWYCFLFKQSLWIKYVINKVKLKIITTAIAIVFGFTMLLTSQVISVAFYRVCEKSDKFCSEALILAWGSFMCRKSTTWDPQLNFPSELKVYSGFLCSEKSIEPTNLGSRGEYDNHWTTRVN